MEKKQLNEIICSFETYFISRLCRSINKKCKELTTKIVGNDDDEPINDEANIDKEKSNKNDKKEYDDDNTGENETDDEEEEPMQDNHNDNDQPNVSKITIKEDVIDDDVQGNLIFL
ncbi:unnamed protein product [Rotaria sp. Silwood2]|nr:unnamed protein product [Rotaria sp. Silwood2]CAF2895487.1 unnamed protein product [Rotaria sp. Silwood2]CAF4290662.1 unnamed protein product [Rotaria sp. Silwood2]CAF4394718.1 unnamed protein product [Rotaria sp. Silwood2]